MRTRTLFAFAKLLRSSITVFRYLLVHLTSIFLLLHHCHALLRKLRFEAILNSFFESCVHSYIQVCAAGVAGSSGVLSAHRRHLRPDGAVANGRHRSCVWQQKRCRRGEVLRGRPEKSPRKSACSSKEKRGTAREQQQRQRRPKWQWCWRQE